MFEDCELLVHKVAGCAVPELWSASREFSIKESSSALLHQPIVTADPTLLIKGIDTPTPLFFLAPEQHPFSCAKFAEPRCARWQAAGRRAGK